MKKTYRQSWSFVGDCYCSYPDPLCLDERNLLLLLHPSAIMISGLRDGKRIINYYGRKPVYWWHKSATGPSKKAPIIPRLKLVVLGATSIKKALEFQLLALFRGGLTNKNICILYLILTTKFIFFKIPQI